jgi:anti-anti-sigma factor
MRNPNQSNLLIKVTEQKQDNAVVVMFNGDLDKLGLDSVRDELDALVEKMTQKYLVYDFTSLNFINSESIGYLSTTYYRVSTNDKILVIVGASDHVLDVLNVIGITNLLKIYQKYEQFQKENK